MRSLHLLNISMLTEPVRADLEAIALYPMMTEGHMRRVQDLRHSVTKMRQSQLRNMNPCFRVCCLSVHL